MGFLGRVFRFAFWVLLISWMVRLVAWLVGGQQAKVPGTNAVPDGVPLSSRQLVRDPVCGTHVAEALALPLLADGQTQYFCSAECRAKYENSLLKRAASA